MPLTDLFVEHKSVSEGEPGAGEQPADSKLAKQLAKQGLANKSALALSYRQLWRHKYIKKNYDPKQAWKLFYWELTHSGAGGKGYNPATRAAAAKLMMAAFSRWGKASMTAKVKRAEGMVDKPVGQISRAEFIKWFVGSSPSTDEDTLSAAFVDETRPDAAPAKLDTREPHERLRLTNAYTNGASFSTGKKVSFPFMHSNESAPNMGGRFQQDIEPAGYYMIIAEKQGIKTWKRAGKDFAHGVATFKNPLVLEFGMGYDKSSWKHALWEKYGKKGKALTRALIKDGYDGIVTVRRNVPSEVVALKGKPKVVETLQGMFVEKEDDEPPEDEPKEKPEKKPAVKKVAKKKKAKKKAPPPPPEDEEDEMSDLETAEEQAEKIGYELKDVQAYYDMQIASGLDQGAALIKTKRKFKLRRIKVSPIGTILAPQVPDPTGLRKKEAALAPPPEPEPEPEPEPAPAGGGGAPPPTGGKFPEGPKGPTGPQGPKGSPGPSDE
jgi:hypothetical protein